jgi:aspartyl-tRNA(Asn)/glutamyl-tRNA(Gln) amidotransferase subunit A
VTALRQGVGGLRIGLATNLLALADEDVAKATEAVGELLCDLGASVRRLEFPDRELTAASRLISNTEAYAYHAADLAELPERYGAPLAQRFKSGGLYFASDYIQAQRARTIVRDAVAVLFRDVDLLLCPTMPSQALTYEEALADTAMRRSGINNVFNYTGQPAIAFPSGFSARGLPLSVQLAGRPFAEAMVLRAAYAYQGVTDWHIRHPELPR